MTPLFKGPLRAPLRHLGAVCCDPRAPTSDACGGPFALNQQGARQRQGGPSGPWPVHVNPNTRPRPWPLGALATTGRAFVVLLCCRVVVLWTQAQSPQPAHQPGPCTPQLAPAGMALSPGPGMCTRPPGEVRSPLPPGLSPCSCARATPAAGRGQGRSAPQRGSSCTCAIAVGSGAGPARTGRPGLGPADARLLRWRGVLQPPSRKQAGPRVPLNRILFNPRCVVASLP